MVCSCLKTFTLIVYKGGEMKEKIKFGIVAGVFAVLAILSITYVGARGVRGVNDVEETTFQVSRLSCGSCLATIEGELRRYDGMVGMRADLARGLVTVSHTEEFTPEQIAAAITGAGYPAEVADVSGQAGQAPTDSGNVQGYGCGRGCGSRGCAFPAAPPEQG